MRGRVGALIALGAGFNPILTGRENIYVNGSVLGLTRREIDAKMEDIIDFAEIREFIDSPVQSYSSGMQVRLGFAVATAMDPDVLILDEVLAVGDAAFRNKCYRRIISLRKKAAVIFVSHNMEEVSRVCDYSLTMSRGRPIYLGEVGAGILAYEELNKDVSENDDSFLSIVSPISSFVAVLPTGQITSGSPLEVSIQIGAEKDIMDFQLRIAVYTDSGQLTAEGRFNSGAFPAAVVAKQSSWSLELNSIPLKNGRYRVSFNIIDSQGDLLVWSYKTHDLEVVGGVAGSSAGCLLGLSHWRSFETKSNPISTSILSKAQDNADSA
jgi:lipopolysaccharide transport system ATP-binding protein